MKKFLTVLLTISILVGVLALPVHAVGKTSDVHERIEFAAEKSNRIFEDNFLAYIPDFNPEDDEPEYYDGIRYQELAYHYTDDKLDWAFVKGFVPLCAPMLTARLFGNRVVENNNINFPFIYTYGVYDVQAETFYDINDVYGQEKYAALSDLLAEFKIGRILGDINGDGVLNIKDATEMQRCLADIRDFPSDDTIYGVPYNGGGKQIRYLSDINLDDVRSIKDVTEIQRILAE